MLQVNHVDQLFEEIEKLKRNNWEVRLRFDKVQLRFVGTHFLFTFSYLPIERIRYLHHKVRSW